MAIEALQHYPVLRRLDITRCRLGDVETFLLDLFKATHQFWIAYNLLHASTCTCGKIETNLKGIKDSGVKQLHAGFREEFETLGLIMPKRSN